jgi:outer membrane receptor protein involved in Fe transport
LALSVSTVAYAQDAAQGAAPDNDLGDIVVTAQKRSQTINSVPMSISAATGDQLIKQGITDASQLAKIVPGFTYTQTAYGTPVYTLRGVGYQDNTLSAAPAVSTYLDEVPIPFPAMTVGLAMDLERVEVLKGPQGILYGQNSTGGAINYIAAKPTDSFQAGFDASYGRFNAIDAQGYVSGPISDTLRVRASARWIRSDDWQKSMTRDDGNGSIDRLMGRFLIDWQPTERLSVAINLNGWRDHSDSQAGQFIASRPLTISQSPPGLVNYPIASDNARQADWTPSFGLRMDNSFYQASARIGLELGENIDLTSITAYLRYKRYLPQDLDGTRLQIFDILETAKSTSLYQELRLSGDMGPLTWMVGGNYQRDRTSEFYDINDRDSSNNPFLGLPFPRALIENQQNVKTLAAFANVEYKLTDTLTLQGGLRYTDSKRDFAGCTRDPGDGTIAAIWTILGGIMGMPASAAPKAGECVIINSVTLRPGLFVDTLKEDNVSWRGGITWSPHRGSLFYANVSRGYKSGTYPTLSGTATNQLAPAPQESVLAYEAGFKQSLFDSLQLNGAAFYYKYSDKQIRGRKPDPVFSALNALVSVPKSTIYGFELSATWQPVQGLTLRPGLTMVHSRIDASGAGNFFNYDPLGARRDFTGEALPYTPKWSGNLDAEYDWALGSSWHAFVGGNYSFQSSSNSAFGELPLFRNDAFQLLDLRAGVESTDGRWRISLFGQNVTNEYYWTSATRNQDTVVRMAGMPATYGLRVTFRHR